MARALTVGSIVLALCAASSTICLGQDSVRVFERRGEVVPADTLVKYLKEGCEIRILGCTINGNLAYHGTITARLLVDSCSFLDSVDFSKATFLAPVGFRDSKFEECMSLFEAKFASLASFINVVFNSAHFKSAIFNHCWFTGAIFEKGANFSDVDFHASADFSGARFLHIANFEAARFHKDAMFLQTETQIADFIDAELLGGVSFSGNGFSKMFLAGTKLIGANFYGVTVGGVVFEPDTISEYCMRSLAHMKGLRDMKYGSNPTALAKLRRFFRKNHYRQQEREITCALERHDQTFLEMLLFDWPFEYGSNLGRPFIIVGFIFVVWAVVYFVLFRSGGQHGVYMIKSTRDPESLDVKKELISFERILGEVRGMRVYMFSRIKVEGKLVGWALFYSLISTFNVGFRDMDFGRWLRLILPKKTDFEPFGWVRTISGLQAIFSILLMAFGLLFYFGRFFD